MRPWTLRLVLLSLLLALAGSAGAGVQPGDPGSGLVRVGGEPAFVPGELIVTFREGASAAARSSVLQASGARVLRGLGAPGVALVQLPAGASVTAQAAALERDPRVLHAEPNFIRKLAGVPNDPLFELLWGMSQPNDKDIDAPAAWNVTKGSKNVVVAVIDSGIAYGHPDLAPNMWTNPGEIPNNGIDDDGNGFIDDVFGWDFIQNDKTPLDYNGHGTHVAGTIGAKGNNKIGVAGVNWNVSLMALRAATASGSLPDSAIISSINYACAMGADVVNGSFGGSSPNAATLTAIKSAPCANTLFVFAAGNSNWNLNGNTGVNDNAYPCEFHRPGHDATNLICVAATGKNDARANFSNYGVSAVHLAAPGVDTLSSWPAYSTVAGGYDGFEGSNAAFNGRWGNRTGPNPAWNRKDLIRTKGTYSLADSPSGLYPNSAIRTIDRLTPLNFSGRIGCRLDYDMWLDSEPNFDFFSILANGNSVVGWSGSTRDFFFALSTDLSAYDGNSNVNLRFRFSSTRA